MPIEDVASRNYLHQGFPVLSFGFALCCDKEFSDANYKIWLDARSSDRTIERCLPT